LTTHQLDEAQQQCDRIVIIDHGRSIAEGSFDALLAQTIGPHRRIVCHLRGPAPAALQHAGWAVSGDGTLTRRVANLTAELPEVLAELTQVSAQIEDLKIESPTLQDVFLHLTGRELRE
jgi:ABC-2 type transport system ATP-binding protein